MYDFGYPGRFLAPGSWLLHQYARASIGMIPEDPAKAAAHYRKAVAGGIVNAIFNLGMLYYNGRGVEKDLYQAIDLWINAFERGHPKATCMLVHLRYRLKSLYLTVSCVDSYQ